MANPSFKLESKEVGRMLRGPEVRKMVGGSASRIAAAAGDGFTSDLWVSAEPGKSGQPRAVGGVTTDSFEARARQRRDNTLLRARDAGRV